jgi:non-specific serine/threonine protein kinase
MSIEPPTPLRGQPVPLAPRVGQDDTARFPMPLTSIIGREAELATTAALLRDPAIRLVTLTGPGGVGKTRLALQLAADLAPVFADGVAFVELAPVRDPALVASTIVQALGIHRADHQPASATLKSVLHLRELLLILDSFERVVEAAPLAIELLQACPRLKALVTSRSLLSVSGEYAAPVPPLSLPSRDVETSRRREETASLLDSSTPRLLDSSAAARLFVERSRAVRPTFALTEPDLQAIAEICARLDGLPLAIELAAARSGLFPPVALLARLNRRLPILTAGPRNLPERQRTMHDAIAWSYDLLSFAEQAVFRRFSLFVGGASIEAVERVCAGPERGGEVDLDVVTVVESLVRQCLLQTTAPPNGDGDGAARLTMLETVREFAAEMLAAGGGETPVRRHAEYYLDLATRAERTYWGDGPGDWRATMHLELGNLRAALTWAIANRDADIALRLASAMIAPHWISGDHAREQQAWVRRALALPGGAAANRLKALTSLGLLASGLNELTEARALNAEALELARRIGDELGIANTSFFLGRSAFHHGDVATARRCLLDALTRFRGQAADGRAAWALCYLASLDSRSAIDEGGHATDLARAAGYYEEALATFRRIDHVRGEARARRGLASVAYKQRDLPRALARTHEVLSLAWTQGWPVYTYLEDIADVAGRVGQPGIAARLYGAADQERERYGRPIPPVFHEEVERERTVARDLLGDAAFASSWAAGRALPIAAALAEALAVSAADSETPRIALTPREQEILPLLVEGLTAREIGATLFLSRRTVEHHLERLRAKFGVQTAAELVDAARAGGHLPRNAIEG